MADEGAGDGTVGRTARRGRVDPIVCVNAVLAVLAASWFVANLRQVRGPVALGWLPAPLSMALASLALRWTTGVAGLPRPARRFWNQISLCSLIVAVGVGVHAHSALTHPRLPAGPGAIPVASLLLFLVTIVIMLWALLRIPMGVRAAGEWLRLGLDATTVMLGTTLFTWYFVLSPLPLTGALARSGSTWSPPRSRWSGWPRSPRSCSPAAGRWTPARSACSPSGSWSVVSARGSRPSSPASRSSPAPSSSCP